MRLSIRRASSASAWVNCAYQLEGACPPPQAARPDLDPVRGHRGLLDARRSCGGIAGPPLITNPNDAPPPPGLLDPERGALRLPPDIDGTEPPCFLAHPQSLWIGDLDRRRRRLPLASTPAPWAPLWLCAGPLGSAGATVVQRFFQGWGSYLPTPGFLPSATTYPLGSGATRLGSKYPPTGVGTSQPGRPFRPMKRQGMEEIMSG